MEKLLTAGNPDANSRIFSPAARRIMIFPMGTNWKFNLQFGRVPYLTFG